MGFKTLIVSSVELFVWACAVAGKTDDGICAKCAKQLRIHDEPLALLPA